MNQLFQLQLNALRQKHKASIDACVDTASLLRDMDHEEFFRARTSEIKRTLKKMRNLRSKRDAIHAAMFGHHQGLKTSGCQKNQCFAIQRN